MSIFLYIIIASVVESCMSLFGVFFAFVGYERFKQYSHYLMSFSIGTFLGVIFFEILPEAVEISDTENVFIFTLIGFLVFFLLSRFLKWYHHHEDGCEKHREIKIGGHLVLAGDFLHNFIDGIIIALAFMASVNIGITTTIAVLVHELPQEISDFFILLRSGFSKTKALFFNFLVSLSTVVGAILAYFFAVNFNNFIAPALGIVAGNFLYIAMSDLIPELETDNQKISNTISQFALISLGVILIYFITLMIPE